MKPAGVLNDVQGGLLFCIGVSSIYYESLHPIFLDYREESHPAFPPLPESQEAGAVKGLVELQTSGEARPETRAPVWFHCVRAIHISLQLGR